MKKQLLLLAALTAFTLPVIAQSDGMTYDDNDIVTITINNTTGTFTKSNANHDYGNEFTCHNDYPGFKIAITNNTSNNMSYDGSGHLQIWSGSGSSIYRFSTLCEDYYVSGFSFTATKANAATTVTPATELESYLTIDGNNYTATEIPETVNIDITVATNNSPVTLTDFTVTLSPKSNPMIPTTAGWYTIQSQGGGTMADYSGYYAANINNEHHQNPNNYYSLKLVAAPEVPLGDANLYINIAPSSGNKFHIKSANGHYAKDNATSALANTTETFIRQGDAANNTVMLGQYWTLYGNSGHAENPLIGCSSSYSDPRWRVVKAHPELRYDVWSVNIPGAPVNSTVLNQNTKVTIINAANKGVASVYDGGTFFVTKGTELTAADITTEAVEGCTAPIVTVDNENKTITVEYMTLQHVIELFNTAKNSRMAIANSWRGVLGEAQYATLTSELSAITLTAEDNSVEAIEAKIAQVEEIEITDASVVNLIQYRVVTIKSLNRNGQYLGVKNNGGTNVANTFEQPVERAKWVIIKNGSEGQFFLYNPETHCYLGTGLGITNANNNRGSFMLTANTSATGGVSLQNKNNADHMDQALGLDNANANAAWTAADNANASLELALAGVSADQIDTTGATFYRIRSNRGITRERGSLVALTNTVVLGDAENNTEVNLTTQRDGIAALWTVKASGEKVKILSVAADFEGAEAPYGIAGNNRTLAKVTADGALLSIKSAIGKGNYPGKDPTAFYIQCPNGNQIDVSNSSYDPIFAEWSGMDAKYNDNGSIFYFEPAYDAEEIIAAYIETANTLCKTNEEFSAEIDLYGGIPALWDAEAIAAAKQANEELSYVTATSVASANACKTTNSTNATAQDEIIATLHGKADGKFVQLYNNRAFNYATLQYLTVNATNKLICSTANPTAIDRIWQVEANSDGKLAFKNYKTNEYIVSQGNNNSNQWGTAATADELQSYFTLTPYFTHDVYTVDMTDQSTSTLYMHNKGNNDVIGWASRGTSGGADWRFKPAEDDDVAAEAPYTMALESSVHKLTFSGATLHEGVTYGDHHTITVWATNEVETDDTEAQAAAPRRAKTHVATGTEPVAYGDLSEATHDANGNAVVALNGRLSEGVYEVRIPTAIFSVGDKHSKSSVSTVSIDANGVATGLDEVAAAVAPAAEAIYDLQGRRLSKPVRGINIIKGRKVLVK